MAEQETVSIHIDNKEYKSPNPTTGAALYTLGSVKAGLVLFREVPGRGDDERIKNDNTAVPLKNGDHFFSTKDDLNPGQ